MCDVRALLKVIDMLVIGGYFLINFVILADEILIMDEIRLKVERLVSAQTGTGAFLMILKEVNKPEPRILPIVIGPFEAQAIMFGLEKTLKPRRPLTHDLMRSIILQLGYKLKKIVINKFADNIFYAQLHLNKDGEEITIDARPSDAVALAVRFDAPIFTVPQVMKQTGADAEKARNLGVEPEELNAADEAQDEDLSREIEEVLDKFEQMMKDNEGFKMFEIDLDEESAKELAENFFKLLQSLFGQAFEGPKGKKKMPDEAEIQKMLDEAIANEDYERAAKLRDALKMLKEMKKRDSEQGENPGEA